MKSWLGKLIMTHFATRHCIREDHQIIDFLWFVPIGFLPVVVACFAIASESWYWLLGYLGYMCIPFASIELRFLCIYCPYYRQQPGLTVHCKSLWGPAKFLKPRPRAPGAIDRAIFYAGCVIAVFFPIYWLALRPELLVIYIMSIIVMVFTLAKYECNQCLFFHCPFNMVSKEMKEEYLKNLEEE
ncbi:MAG TPA: hypothetical protein G4O13_01755 [Dehalococcoidia bacterium]|nr:hypothetical protein [Dehalococcoidia bacterium]